MLVLTRRLGEEIVIDGNIRVTVVGIQGDKIRLGVTAPKFITVDRAEIHERRAEFLEERPRFPRASRPDTSKLPS
jgi:carbon storage regulator